MAAHSLPGSPPQRLPAILEAFLTPWVEEMCFMRLMGLFLKRFSRKRNAGVINLLNDVSFCFPRLHLLPKEEIVKVD